MFRTRDFILVFTAVAFLVMAIGTTVWKQSVSGARVNELLQFSDVGEQVYTAEVYVAEQLSREERVSEMRRKIAESGSITISAPAEVEEDVIEETVAEDDELVLAALQECSNYTEYHGQWSTSGIIMEEVEGARIVFREKPVTTAVTGSSLEASTSAPIIQTIFQRDILLQLPVRNIPATRATCLSSDVVGVAKDGSLIRNNETGLYSVFGADTLVGYALDGFPIYGVTTAVTDKCGGQLVNGLYGYYLSDERDVILNCFSGIPVTL